MEIEMNDDWEEILDAFPRISLNSPEVAIRSFNLLFLEDNLKGYSKQYLNEVYWLKRVRDTLEILETSETQVLNIYLPLTVNQMPRLLRTLRLNCHLRELNLENTNLQASLPELVISLQDNVTLKILNLSSNVMDGFGSYMIGILLSKNHVLEKLDLSSNHIDDVGAMTIARSVRNNTGLKSLNLARNFLTDRGGHWLNFYFNRAPFVLEEIHLGRQEIDRERIDKIHSAMFIARNMCVLRSAQLVPRIAAVNGAIRRLPLELTQLVMEMLVQKIKYED